MSASPVVIHRNHLGLVAPFAPLARSLPMESRENVMRVLRWYLHGWLGIFRFHGRARRGELWSYYVINKVIIGLTAYVVGDAPAFAFAVVQALPLFALAGR